MGETARTVGLILLTLALFVSCTTGPLLLARDVHPSAGCLTVVLWTKFVRPTFGCVQGTVAVVGFVGILEVLLICPIRLFV